MRNRSIRLEDSQIRDIATIAKLNRITPTDVIRLATDCLIAATKRDGGRLPFAPAAQAPEPNAAITNTVTDEDEFFAAVGFSKGPETEGKP